ncbi:MAG: hypothetical protein HQL51_08930 [Magnetococcales bacterium]|nr:hypothetical protein [Magnetococcales bacterium]
MAYTHDMYRAASLSRDDLLARVKEKIRQPQALEPLDGVSADLAGDGRQFFVAENSDRLVEQMKTVSAFAQAKRRVVLAVPHQIKDSALQIWDYLPAAEQEEVRILLIPDASGPD